MYLQRPFRTAFSLVLSMMTLVVGLSISFGASAGPVSATANDDELVFVQLINRIRTEKGLEPLAVDGELTNAARSWSSVMASNDSLAHSPDMAAGISAQWTVLGENVGVHGIHDVQELFQAFVDSPSHYRNLIDPRFRSVGVGVVHASNGKLWTTHRFMATSTTTETPPAEPSGTKPTTPDQAPPATPDSAPPSTTPPVTAPPATNPPPTTSPPATDPPVTDRPVDDQPVIAQPTTAQPATAPPATGEPATGPNADDPLDSAAPTTTPSNPATTTDPTGSSDAGVVNAPIAEVQAASPGAGGTAPQDDMADLVKPDIETIETVLIDLMLAGV